MKITLLKTTLKNRVRGDLIKKTVKRMTSCIFQITPSLLKERVTNSCLIEVSESFIPDDFMRTYLGGND